MLTKLLKHEFRATVRIFAPMYALLILFSLINKLCISQPFFQELLGGLPSILVQIGLAVLVAAVSAMSVIVTIQRFYKNLLGDEGYLMHTLPTTPFRLITSKLVVATVWNTLSLLLVLVCGLYTGMSWYDFLALPDRFAQVMRIASGVWGINLFLVALEILGAAMLLMVYLALMFYISMSLGQLFNKHKLAMSFVAFFLITTAVQIIVTYVLYQVSRSYVITFNTAEPMTILHTVTLYIAGFTALFGGLYYAASSILLKRRLNL